jgi:hypothetical protein
LGVLGGHYQLKQDMNGDRGREMRRGRGMEYVCSRRHEPTEAGFIYFFKLIYVFIETVQIHIFSSSKKHIVLGNTVQAWFVRWAFSRRMSLIPIAHVFIVPYKR